MEKALAALLAVLLFAGPVPVHALVAEEKHHGEIAGAPRAEPSRPINACERKGILSDLEKGLAFLLNFSHGERQLSEFTEEYLRQRDLTPVQRGFLGEQALRTHNLSKAASLLHERLLTAKKCVKGAPLRHGLYLVPVRCFREARLLRTASQLRMEVVVLRNQLRDGKKDLVKGNPPANRCGKRPCRFCLGAVIDGLRRNQDIVLEAIAQTGIRG